MVNKTFLPPSVYPCKTPKPFKNQHFLNWHGFRSDVGEPGGAWESPLTVCEIRKLSLGEPRTDRFEGENHRWRIRFSSDFRGR
jgi:hypothetical protein